MNRIWCALELLAIGLAIALASAPAMASTVRVPEPGTLSLLTVGIGGAYLVSKYLRRK
mgnify:CR=1 FL=1